MAENNTATKKTYPMVEALTEALNCSKEHAIVLGLVATLLSISEEKHTKKVLEKFVTQAVD